MVFHNLIDLSSDELTKVFLLFNKYNDKQLLLCASEFIDLTLFVFISQTRIELSLEQLTKSPLFKNIKSFIGPKWPVKLLRNLNSSVVQILISLSPLPLTKFEFGNMANDRTQSACPFKVVISRYGDSDFLIF